MGRRIIIDELEFEVPYGKLAAKTWHEEEEQSKRVLVLHGWMDNAGSFDNLMPLLKHKDGLYVVALDLPGHGKSSQLPPGSSYSDLNIVMEIRRCLTELRWIQRREKKSSNGGMVHSASQDSIRSMGDGEPRKKFSIIGHSLGAGLGLFYTSLYPDDVDDIVLLDFIKPKTTPNEVLIQNTAEVIDQFIDTVPSQSPFSSPTISKMTLSNANPNKTADKGQVVVSQEAAIIATINAHKTLGELSRDDAMCLLKRSTVAISTPSNSVIYSRDLRLNSMLNLRDNLDVQKLMFYRVKCNMFFILGKNGMYAEDPAFRNNMDEMEAFLRERAKNFYLQWTDGDHYLHMNTPNRLAATINRFFEDPASFRVTDE